MSLPLLPPLEFGKTRARREDVLGYSDMDFYGVQEAPVNTTDDMRGPNEEFRFLRDAHTFITTDHDENGIHDILPIARLYISATFSNGAYNVEDFCYVIGTSYHVVPGSMSVGRISDGVIEVQLLGAYSLPNSAYLGNIDRFTSDRTWEDTMVKLRISSVTSAKIFRLKRYEGETHAAMTLTDGPFVASIYCEA